MSKNQDDITLLPVNREYLYDADKKIGSLDFTLAEKRALLELTTTKGWEVLSKVYVKQRAVQLSVAALNIAQDEKDLFMYKGKANEVDQFVKVTEDIARKLRREEQEKNTPTK